MLKLLARYRQLSQRIVEDQDMKENFLSSTAFPFKEDSKSVENLCNLAIAVAIVQFD